MRPAPLRRDRPRARAATVVGLGVVLATLTALLTSYESEILLWLAAVYVYTAAGFLALGALESWQLGREEVSRLAASRHLSPEALTGHAVAAERRRLALDIRAVLQETLREVHESSGRLLAAAPGADDGEVVRMRERTQLATSELRRLLGILRVAEDTDTGTSGTDTGAPGTDTGASGTDTGRTSAEGAAPGPGAGRPGRPPLLDVVQAVVLVLLALLECWLNQRHRLGVLDPSVMVTTALAAAAFVGRTTAPVMTAVAQSLIFAVGFWAGAPVMSGVWLVRGVGGTIWANAAGAPGARPVSAALLLSTTVLATRAEEPPIGVLATLGAVVVALLGGLLVGRGRERQRRAATEALELERAREATVRRAVAAERIRMARELHDVISHSVGLIAVQLNVLDVAPGRSARDRALRNIHASSGEAMRELSDLNTFQDSPGTSGPRTLTDLESLVRRVRRAGRQVDLSVLGEPPQAVLPVVYRILQEALTNTLLHAPGARVQVRVEQDGAGTRLLVADDGPGAASPRPHRFGLVGLAERVALFGGTLESGTAGESGGFVVRAHIPDPGPRAAPDQDARHLQAGAGATAMLRTE